MATEQEVIERFRNWHDPRNRFMQFTRNECCFVERDKAVLKLTITDNDRNQFGSLHGGAMANLADNAAGMAAHTDGRQYVTQSSTYQFIRNQIDGTVYATATIRHRGRTTCLVHIEITNEEGKLMACAEFSMFCVGTISSNDD